MSASETVKTDAPVPGARAEVSLYSRVLGIKQRHGLEKLGIAFWDSETTLQWAYNADESFHAASTMKLAVLLAVYRQVSRSELTLDAPVHVRNKFRSGVGGQVGGAHGPSRAAQGLQHALQRLLRAAPA